MVKIAPTFTFNSSLHSLSLLSLQRFVMGRRAKQAGWTLAKTLQLINALQTALTRFENMTAHELNFMLDLTMADPPDQKDLYVIDRENSSIAVFLSQGPNRILANVPTMIGRELGRIFLEKRFQDKTISGNPAFSVIEDVSRIEYGLRMIKTFYRQERNTEVNDADLRAVFSSLVEHYGEDLVQRKFAFRLLQPHVNPTLRIEAEVKKVTADFYARIFSSIIEQKDVPLWSMIAALAMLATLAKRNNAAQSYIACQNVLNDESGKQLASIELLTRPDEDIEYFKQYPIETERQLQLAPSGFNIVFNAFVHVFDYYYKNVRLEV